MIQSWRQPSTVWKVVRRRLTVVWVISATFVIADWSRCDGQKLARDLGFTYDQTPCAATLHYVLRQPDGSLMEAALPETLTACDTVDHGHGRLEERRLTASTALAET